MNFNINQQLYKCTLLKNYIYIHVFNFKEKLFILKKKKKKIQKILSKLKRNC